MSRLMIVPWLVLAAGCASASVQAQQRYLDNANIHKYRVVDAAPVVSGPFQVQIQDVYTGAEATNYFLVVTVRNQSAAEATFDTGELELVDEATGISYFSFTRDKTSLGGPFGGGGDLISTVRLGPGRAAEGRLLFLTSMKKAVGARLTLHLGKATASIEHVKQLTGEDVPAESPSGS